MAALTLPKAPKGFEMFQFPTRGGQSASTYSMLSQAFPELLSQAQGAPGAFDAIEKYGKNVFEQQIAPSIGARYAGTGIGSSSGMQNALASAGANLSEALAAKRADLMQQSMRNVLSLGDLLLARPDMETAFMRKGPSFWQKFLGIGSPIAGGALGAFGGPLGALAGAQIGGSVGQSFLG